MLHELPLVIFTIAAQMSVGSFVVLGLINVLGARKPQEVLRQVTNPAMYAIGPLLVFGLAASTMHLGTPIRAANSLLNVGGSWLSREILFGSGFAALGALFAVSEWFQLFTNRVRQLIATLAAVVGLGLVAMIGQVYSLRTVPAWATPMTTVRFYITTFLLGSLAVAAALVITSWFRRNSMDERTAEMMTSSIRGLSLAAVITLGIKFISEPLYFGFLASHPNPAAHESLQLLTDTYGGFLAFEYLLIFAALLAMGFVLFKLAKGTLKTATLSGWILVAFAFALAGEVFGRMLFYASMVRVGM